MRLRLNYCIYKGHLIGKGGFGKVVLGTVKGSEGTPLRHRLVAVKYIDKRTAGNEIDHVVQLNKVAAAAGQRDTVGIMQVYDYVLRDKVLISPLYGPDLGKCVPRHVGLSGVQVAQILQQMLAALSFCHNNAVMHMDVKPGNFVVSYTVPHARVFLIDFGLSQRANTAAKGRRIGSPRFMSINMHEMGVPTFTDDLFSMVFTACALLNGELPWSGVGASRHRHEVLAAHKRRTDISGLFNKDPALQRHVNAFYTYISTKVGFMQRATPGTDALYTALRTVVQDAPPLSLNISC